MPFRASNPVPVTVTRAGRKVVDAGAGTKQLDPVSVTYVGEVITPKQKPFERFEGQGGVVTLYHKSFTFSREDNPGPPADVRVNDAITYPQDPLHRWTVQNVIAEPVDHPWVVQADCWSKQ